MEVVCMVVMVAATIRVMAPVKELATHPAYMGAVIYQITKFNLKSIKVIARLVK